MVVGKELKQKEFDTLKDEILEFYKKHNKLNVFYCGDDFIGWSLGLESGFLESVEGIHTMPGIFSAIEPDRWICKFCFTENDKNSGSCEKCGSPKGLSV